jgi:plasmid stabilization system protein ParE
MKTVYWTPGARLRLQEIQQYIRDQHAGKAAEKMVATLLKRTRQLEAIPLSGHKIPGYPEDELRELLENPYRIIYRVKAQKIEILTVMHYRQLLSTTLRSLRLEDKGK